MYLFKIKPLFVIMKKFIAISLFLFFIGHLPLKAQFTESKERKKMWHKSGKRHKAREAYNPYLKKKEKPSQKLSKQNAREQKRQLKAAKKQKRKSMKKLGYKETKVKRP
jgi:hypothetical protein